MKTVEILLYSLQTGTGEAFHQIMHEISVPLHRTCGMDVVRYGQSLHDPDSYYLIRAYDNAEHLETSQSAFYASDAWRSGPRESIIALIASSIKSVIALDNAALGALRQADL
ncbi:MAG: NIPSNAP family protein [Serratia sp. (in: enterobacteria)]